MNIWQENVGQEHKSMFQPKSNKRNKDIQTPAKLKSDVRMLKALGVGSLKETNKKWKCPCVAPPASRWGRKLPQLILP